jgi:hypothetical protein
MARSPNDFGTGRPELGDRPWKGRITGGNTHPMSMHGDSNERLTRNSTNSRSSLSKMNSRPKGENSTTLSTIRFSKIC